MNTTEENLMSDTESLQKRLTLVSKSHHQWTFKHLPEKSEQLENLKDILKAVYEKEKLYYDDRDICVQPRYSKFQVPYYIKCRNRYNACKKQYEQRFQYEIEHLIAQQTTGYEAARLNRHLCITTLWPPLHSRTEINHTQRYFFSLPAKERKRLNWIMNTNIL